MKIMKKQVLLALFVALVAAMMLSGCRGKSGGASSNAASSKDARVTASELFPQTGTNSETKLTSSETQSLFKAQESKTASEKAASAASSSKTTSKNPGTANAGNLDKNGDGWTDGWN